MKPRLRTLVFLSAGVALGLIGGRMRKIPEPATMPTDALPRPLQASPSGHAPSSYRVSRSVHAKDIPATDSRYNPAALLQQDPDIHLKDIFDAEPRDAQFAPVMEKRIHDSLDIIASELKLDDTFRSITTVCKTLSCYTEIEVPEGEAELVYDEINGILLGDHQTPGIAENGHSNLVTVYNVYRPETRDAAYYKRFLAEAMRMPLELAKKKFLKNKSEDK